MSEIFWILLGGFIVWTYMAYKAGTLAGKLQALKSDVAAVEPGLLAKLQSVAQAIEAKLHGSATTPPAVPVAAASPVAQQPVYAPLAAAQAATTSQASVDAMSAFLAAAKKA